MNCEELQDKIYAFLYGEIDVVELKGVQEHVDGCGCCNYERKIIEQILEKVKGCDGDCEVPETFKMKVMARIQTFTSGSAD